MDSLARRGSGVKGFYILHSCRFQHFGGIIHHVFTHLVLIFFEACIKYNSWEAPYIFFIMIQVNPVLKIRQAFSKSAESHSPDARLGKQVLEIRPDAHFRDTPLPAATGSAALVTEAAYIIPPVLIAYIAVTGNVYAIGPASEIILVFESGCLAGGAVPEMMIHQVMPKYPAIVTQPVGKAAGNGI